MTLRRIYVSCLASYNNGVLYGEWIDATQSADAIREDIAKMLRGSSYPNVTVDCPTCGGVGCEKCEATGKVPSAEEWAIHDYEGFEGIKLSEHEDIESLASLAELLEEHGEAYAAYVGQVGLQYATPEDFQDKYRGECDSDKDYAESFIEECYSDVLKGLPDILKYHIDYEGIAHDMRVGGDVSFVEHGSKVFVFDNH